MDVNGNLLLQNTAVLSSAANAIDVEGNIDIQNTAVLGNGTSTNINIGGNWSAVNAASFVSKVAVPLRLMGPSRSPLQIRWERHLIIS